MVPFDKQKFLVLIHSQLLLFAIMGNVSVYYARNLCGYETFSHVLFWKLYVLPLTFRSVISLELRFLFGDRQRLAYSPVLSASSLQRTVH